MNREIHYRVEISVCIYSAFSEEDIKVAKKVEWDLLCLLFASMQGDQASYFSRTCHLFLALCPVK